MILAMLEGDKLLASLADMLSKLPEYKTVRNSNICSHFPIVFISDILFRCLNDFLRSFVSHFEWFGELRMCNRLFILLKLQA